MSKLSQNQEGGDGSTNLQAGQIIINEGLKYQDVKQIAKDVFEQNFVMLAGNAADIAKDRAEQITEDFLKKLQNENPKGLASAEDPDFQYALFSVQKEFARNGDKDLGDLLVDLLVDRSKQDQRNILQIVLNESLNIAPKLTDDQLAVLTVIFIFRYTQVPGVKNIDHFGEILDKRIMPFSNKLPKNQACYQHLQFTGCGSILIGLDLASLIGLHYQGLFLKGFDSSEIEKREVSTGINSRFFTHCPNDPEKLQVAAINKEVLEKIFDEEKLGDSDRQKILALFDVNKMTAQEIKDRCIEIRPYMETVFDVWENSSIKELTLTSVGIAIGHANIKRLVGEFSDLSIWIN